MRILIFAPFTLSIPVLSLSLSPLYPFPLSIPFTSLSLSPLNPLHLSIPFNSLFLSLLYPFPLSIPFPFLSLSPLYPFHLSLSLLSLLTSLYLSFYLSFSLSFSLAYLMDVFILVIHKCLVVHNEHPKLMQNLYLHYIISQRRMLFYLVWLCLRWIRFWTWFINWLSFVQSKYDLKLGRYY